MEQQGDTKGLLLKAVKELKTGMYVDQLDRPWIETPYLFQGFMIKTQADIDELARYCEHVYVSPEKSEYFRAKPLTPRSRPRQSAKPVVSVIKKPFVQRIPEEDSTKTPFHGNVTYVDRRTMDEELPHATRIYKKAEVLITKIKQDIQQSSSMDVGMARELVTVIVSSIINNPDALLLMNSFRTTHQDEYNRALNTSVYLISFGRHLCLPAEELSLLGLGGLLMDIGELKIPRDTKNEQGVFKIHKDAALHVQYGADILSKIPGIPPEVMDITLQHHEREDGSGYPNSISGSQISNYARMAAIVDCYEKMITHGLDENFTPLSPYEALQMLWDWARRWLNATLVQRFAHCIGLFPVGSLVELNSGEVAIVLSHSRSNRMRPRVMLLLDSEKVRYSAPRELDLAVNPLNPTGVLYEISRDLESNAYGIDPRKFYI